MLMLFRTFLHCNINIALAGDGYLFLRTIVWGEGGTGGSLSGGIYCCQQCYCWSPGLLLFILGVLKSNCAKKQTGGLILAKGSCVWYVAMRQ